MSIRDTCGAPEWRYDDNGDEIEARPTFCCTLPPGHPGLHWDQAEGMEW